MYFKQTYKKITPWWKPIRAEFVTVHSHTVITAILGYNIDCMFGTLTPDGKLTTKPDFVFGASGPTWDTLSSHRGSCFHDLLYYMAQKGFFNNEVSDNVRAMADNLLYFMILEDGMWEFRAEAWFRAVRSLGDTSWEG